MSSLDAHPARLRALAAAYGLGSFELGSFRYLELGCGDGEGLFALAERFPGAQFVGTDRPDALVHARRAAVELGLSNVRFVGEETLSGGFDFVVASRGFAERDEDMRRRYLAAVSALLAADGVALLAYEVLPWGAVRHALRRSLLRSGRAGMSLAERVEAARVRLAQIAAVGTVPDPVREAILHGELERAAMRQAGAPLGALESLAVPLDVTEVVEAARSAGLEYLGEAVPASPDGGLEHATLPKLLGDGVPRIEAEAILDLVGSRSERASLFAHVGELFHSRPDFGPLAKTGFYAGSFGVASDVSLEPAVPMTFVTPRGAHLESDVPRFKALLLTLAEEWPRGLTRDELIREMDERLRVAGQPAACIEGDPHAYVEVCSDLDELVSRRTVELLAWTPDIAEELDYRPCLARSPRLALARGGLLLGARHEPLVLDPFLRAVAVALDGKTGIADLRAAFGARFDAGEFDADPLPTETAARDHVLNVLVTSAMGRLLRLGLLAPPSPEANEDGGGDGDLPYPSVANEPGA